MDPRAKRSLPVTCGLLAAALALLCGACGNSTSRAATNRAEAVRTRIIVVMEENHAESTIVGAPDLPHFNRLVRDGTLLTRYFSVGHPSLPNYLALTSGSIHGLHDDCGNCSFPGPNLGQQLEDAHISWKLYAQGLPGVCPHAESAGAYARRHVPFLYYDGIEHSASLCAHVVPYTQFAIDARADNLPTFAMVIPDVDHDMHGRVENFDDRTARAGADTFIGSLYATLMSSSAWHDDTRLVVTWDEAGSTNPAPTSCCGGDANGGRIATIVAGPRVAHGTDATTYDHYSLLRSIEERYHLARLGKAADANSNDIPVVAA